MTTTNDNFIEWHGPKPHTPGPLVYPVAEGTLVDILLRNCSIVRGVRVGFVEDDDDFPEDASSAFWLDEGMEIDIVGYQLARTDL